MSKIYIIGSLRNANVREIGHALREAGHEVFDDWHACHPDSDTHWREYEIERGRGFQQALDGPFVAHSFAFDKENLDAADIGVLVLPAGKSGHLELGYMVGSGKRGIILLDKEPERWDVMYCFAKVVSSIEELVKEIK